VLLFTDQDRPGAAGFSLALSAGEGLLLAEVARLEALGAVVREKWHRGGGVGTVWLADPEGNTFCVDPGREEAESRLLSPEGRAEPEPFWDDAHQPSGAGRTVAWVRVAGRPGGLEHRGRE
jgi:hypothetical protein